MASFKIHIRIGLSILFLVLFSAANAQHSDSSNLSKQKKLSVSDTSNFKYQKDLFDVLQSVFKASKLFKDDTISKRKGKLYISVVPAIGYSYSTNFAASVGFNGAIYTDNPDSVNLSAGNISPTVTVKKQLIVPLQTNIWTKKNKYNLVGNWIFYKFPENTYGLGGQNSLNNEDPIDYNLILFRETILRSIIPDLFLGLGYNLDYHWNIVESGSAADSHNYIDLYDNNKFQNSSSSSGITYNFLYDTRRNPLNPPGGEYVNLILRTNYAFLGSNTNWNSLLVDLRKYFKFPGRSKNILAIWSYSWLTLSGKPPYLDLPATAWDTYSNQGRGYIQSRFRGRDLLALEAEYRFGITRNGLLGAVVSSNMQTVSDYPNNKFTTFWPGVGTGIRIKLNKHSNTNLAIDYAVGLGGSRGFFVNLGEVF